MNNLWDLLPSEIINNIYSYNPDHRENYVWVMDQLHKYHNETYCHNDMCEKDLWKTNAIEKEVCGMTCYFCDNDHCASYGTWSIMYDMRKRMRPLMPYR